MIEVREINDLSGLNAYRQVWSTLLQHTPRATFFHSLEWLESYWMHYRADQRLRVLVVQQGSTTIGILPLVEKTTTTRAGNIRALAYPLDSWGTFYGPIGAAAHLTLLHAMVHVRQTPWNWDVIDLRGIDPAEQGTITSQAMREAGLPATQSPGAAAAIADLHEGWDHYWASRKSHWRTNVRSCEKKLHRHGKLEHVRYRPLGSAPCDDDPRWDLYDLCQHLAEQSWQGTSTTGTTLSHEVIRQFMRDTHERAVKLGMLDLNLLLVDGRPAAFNYNYVLGGQVTGLRMGFNRAVAKDGAGTYLQYLTLKDSCERGDQTFDLGIEYLRCKRNWQSEIVQTSRCTYYAPLSLRGQVLRLKRSVENWWAQPDVQTMAAAAH